MKEIDFRDYFYYDETSPSCLRWKVDRYTNQYKSVLLAKAGSAAGSKCKRGYWTTRLYNHDLKVHRIVLMLHGRTLSQGDVVDHLNGDRSDNRISNLSLTTQAINSRNRVKNSANSTGTTGVHFTTMIMITGRFTYAVASWVESGKNKSKMFSVNKHGIMPAFKLACMHRTLMIKKLNQLGDGYTERHGK